LHFLIEFENGVVDQKVERGHQFGYLWDDNQHKWTSNIIDQ
jgi:hypothetical protein